MSLQVIMDKHRWALEELVYDRKMQEANRLVSGKGMTEYLIRELGSPKAVIAMASHLVVEQGLRAKTLAGIKECPRCTSPEPHLHPIGKVCSDPFHLQVTAENTKKRIAEVKKLLRNKK